jgi:hypothetical protein
MLEMNNQYAQIRAKVQNADKILFTSSPRTVSPTDAASIRSV